MKRLRHIAVFFFLLSGCESKLAVEQEAASVVKQSKNGQQEQKPTHAVHPRADKEGYLSEIQFDDQVFENSENVRKRLAQTLTEGQEIPRWQPTDQLAFSLRKWKTGCSVKSFDSQEAAFDFIAKRLAVLDYFHSHRDQAKVSQLLLLAERLATLADYLKKPMVAAQIAEVYILPYVAQSEVDATVSGNTISMLHYAEVIFAETGQTEKRQAVYRLMIAHGALSDADYARLRLFEIADNRKDFCQALFWLERLTEDGNFQSARMLIPKYQRLTRDSTTKKHPKKGTLPK